MPKCSTKSLDKLNGGHLIRLMFGINAPIQTELKMLTEKIIIIILSNKLDKSAGEIKVVIQEGEITSLKKTIFNQQIFLESIQKKGAKKQSYSVWRTEWESYF